ncbi:hypothetical protein [Streptomyces sp. NL15-2K]|uniref:hypothetical protein n=1 Tax=Streptomyces sp. NL15-2K TaxID=376149 RepID=UPI000F583A68|nr:MULTISPECIES: hypothetical protein [Actinomycetes]WKX14255.1 hypothetical protein Q4V64_44775 [Kutzneria buriramensis]
MIGRGPTEIATERSHQHRCVYFRERFASPYSKNVMAVWMVQFWLVVGCCPVFGPYLLVGVLAGAGLDAVPVVGGVQGVEDGPADGADEIDGSRRGQDPGRADDGVGGSGQQDGEAHAVHVQAGPGAGGVGGCTDQGLVGGEQRVDLLVKPGQPA